MPNVRFPSLPDPIYSSHGQSPIALSGRIWNVQNAAADWSLQKASNRPILRFEARQGDHFGLQTDRVRSELQCATKDQVSGSDVWFSFSINVDSVNVLSSDLVIAQFHQTEDEGDFSGYPPFEINLRSDGVYIYTAHSQSFSTPLPYPKTKRAGPVNFPFESWNRFVGRCRFGWDNNAALDVWLNGASIVSLSGINMGMNDAVGPYFKFGIYWSPDSVQQTVVAKFTNIEIGAESLISRVDSPLPIF